MVTAAEICEGMNRRAPFYMKMDFDNIGLLAGWPEKEVHRALAALDITDAVIEEAIQTGADLIVSHHPLIWDALKQVTQDHPKGRKLIRLFSNGISALCLHTNLDSAEGGVNDVLMEALGGQVTGLLSPHGAHPDGRPFGIARLGQLPEETDFFVFLQRVKENLKANGLRYVTSGRPVHKLCCCGGSGGGEIEEVFQSGCDTYVTADLKYDHFLWAKEQGLNLIDADHFCTENVVVPVLADWLKKDFPELEVLISQVHGQTIQFF